MNHETQYDKINNANSTITTTTTKNYNTIRISNDRTIIEWLINGKCIRKFIFSNDRSVSLYAVWFNICKVINPKRKKIKANAATFVAKKRLRCFRVISPFIASHPLQYITDIT